MRKKFITLSLIGLAFNVALSYAQEVADTRNVNELPAYFKRIVSYDFKERAIVGLPGNGVYSGMMTFAPWGDASGGENFQLNFNADGIFFRQGLPGNLWGSWRNLVIANNDRVITADAGAGALQLKPGSKDHTYLEFYARSNASTTRSAWLGYGEGGGVDLVAHNEVTAGNINLMTTNGFVGIDTRTPKEKLSVNGKIRAHEIKVETANWPDYVFEQDYPITALPDLEQYIKTHKHLPEMPSAKEIIANGLALGEMLKLQQQKIEELTLHLIEKDKQLMEERKTNKNQQAELEAIKKDLSTLMKTLKP